MPAAYRCAVQSTTCTGSDSTACQVSASVVPVTGSPREAWKLRSTASVAASNVDVTPSVESNETRCCWSQTTSSPLLPFCNAGQPGSGGGSGSGESGRVKTSQLALEVDCHDHQDRPPAP